MTASSSLPIREPGDFEKNHRILIVDDNEAIHSDFLKILGGDATGNAEFDAEEAEIFSQAVIACPLPEFELTFATQGSQALELVVAFKRDGRHFSVAFIDVRMPPGFDGLETAARLWEVDPDLQIVICTAYSDKSWEEMIGGLKHPERLLILKKPFESVEVLQLSHALTEKWSLLQASRRNMQDLECTVSERTRELVATNVRLEQETARHKISAEQVREQAMLLENARDAIVVRDLDDTILYWNQGATDCYGWTAVEAVGRNKVDLLYGGVPSPEDIAARLAVLEKGGWNGELNHTTKDGVLIIVECHCNLLRDADGHPKSILSINNNITERRKLEQQFLRAQRMESIGTLAGGIAHDLNNVLAPIMMSIELLRTYVSDPNGLEILDIVEKSAQRGADMVGQVLTFARGIEGRTEDVDVSLVAGELVRIVEDTFPKSIHIDAAIDENLWLVKGDTTQIHQVLLNLCVNARDAMPHGGCISLKVENIFLNAHYPGTNIGDKPGPYLKIEVQDTGEGIPKELVGKLFDPFFTTKEVGKGTGLGLSTSLAIIKGHRGFIKVHSDPGMGACFQIYLPADPDVCLAALEQPAASLPRGNGETVLVVDDEASIRQITRQTLEAFGYKVLLASDGSEAIKIYVEHGSEIAVVLTDMMMPVMDGPDTIQALLKLCPRLRIIGASGINSHGKVAKAVDAGVNHFLPKPYTATTLLRGIREILAQESGNLQLQPT